MLHAIIVNDKRVGNMSFNFEIMGLMVLFLMIIVYYYKDLINPKDSIVFRGMMIATYILQLMYVFVFITSFEGNFMIITAKLYLIILIFIYSLLLLYVVSSICRDKYIVKKSIQENKVLGYKKKIYLLDLLLAVMVFFLDLQVTDNVIGGKCLILVYSMLVIFSLDAVFLLLKNKEYIKKSKYYKLLASSFISFLVVLLGIWLKGSVVNTGVVILLLYIYLVLESSYLLELDKLRLERDYALKSCMDKNLFLNELSYEIRLPLNTIEGFSQVIMESDDVDSIKNDVRDINAATHNLIDLINGMMDLSVIDSGKLEIIKENYNFYNMVENIEDIIKIRIKDDSVKLVLDIDKNIPDILNGDSARIEQVLINIFSYFLKESKMGNLNFKIDVINSTNRCRLKFIINNKKMIISNEVLSSIFDIISSNGEKSHSLELIVANKLVELMDGKIDVESNDTDGTTFVVTIDQKIGLEGEKIKELKKENFKYFDCHKKRVLVVDDNKLNLKVACRLLGPYNVDVREAISAEECLNVLDKDTNFDLILMDDMMPKMSGTEAMEIIRKIGRVSGFDIPIVVLTANAISGIKNKYLQSGFDDYLAKPIDKYELNRVLKKYLKNSNKD